MKYKYPCCGYYTFGERPDATFDICPVCFWEDDSSWADEDQVSSANGVTLKRARENYLEFGACTVNMIPHVRGPLRNERKKPVQRHIRKWSGRRKNN